MKTSSVPLWPGNPPGALGTSENDIPTLTSFLPTSAPRGAMLVLPGGGYGMLASHEGQGYAEWFAQNGYAAFVLRYRLGSHEYRHPVMLQDAARALRWLRFRAPEFGIPTNRIGIIGSSAGGHLASTLLTHFDSGNPDSTDEIDRESSRPDLGILCYPVITLKQWTHGGTLENLLGKNPDPTLIEFLSNETHVTPKTPPTFLWHTVEDPVVPIENSLLFAAALRKNQVPFELHLYEKGPHGIGLANGHLWGAECLRWLQERWIS